MPDFDPSQPFTVLPSPKYGQDTGPQFDQSKPYTVVGEPTATEGPDQIGPAQEAEKKGFFSYIADALLGESVLAHKVVDKGMVPVVRASKALPFATEMEALRENEQTKKNAEMGLPYNTPQTGLGSVETAAKVSAGVEDAVGPVLDFFGSPVGVSTLGIGGLPKAAQAIIAAGFSVKLASEYPQIAKDLTKAVKEGDTRGATKAASEALINTFFLYKTTGHALSAGKEALGGKPIDGEAEYIGQEPKPAGSTKVTTDQPVIDITEPGQRASKLDQPKGQLDLPGQKVLEFNPTDPQQQGVVLHAAMEALQKALGIPQAPKALPAPQEPPVRSSNPQPVPASPTAISTVREGIPDSSVLSFVESGQAYPLARQVASSFNVPGKPQAELANDAVTHLWEKADQYQPGQAVEPWAGTVMRNYITSQARPTRLQASTISLDEPVSASGEKGLSTGDLIPAETTSPAEHAHLGGVMEVYRQARAELAPAEQALLDGIERGESQADTARQLGITQQALSQRLPAIRQKLAARLAQAGIEPQDYLDVANGLDGQEQSAPKGPGIRPGINPRAGEAGFASFDFLEPLGRILRPYFDKGISLARAAGDMVRLFGQKVIGFVRQAWGRNADPNTPTGLARIGQKYFTSRGSLPEAADVARSTYRGALAEWNKSILMTARGIEAAGRKINGRFTGLTEGDLSQVDAYLRGNARLADLPEALRAPVATARAQIDHLSGEIINSGVIQSGDLVDTFIRNMGKYMSRSYQIHTDRNWHRKLPKERVDAAVQYVQDQARDAGHPITEAEAIGTINEILKTPHSERVYVSNKTVEGSKNLGILQQRKAIPEVFRKLYGENTDPITNYAVTAGKQAQLLEAHKYLAKVKEAGLGTFLFPRPTGQYHFRIAAETTPALSPLNGLYTTEDILQALQLNPVTNPSGFFGQLVKGYRYLNGWVNWAHTVGDYTGQIRNFISNPLISVANGNWQLWKVPSTLKAMAADLGWADSAGARKDLLRMYQLDLLGSGPVGVNRDRLQSAGMKMTDTPSEDFSRKVSAKLKGGTIGFLDEMWRQGDNVYRIYDWKNEVARMRLAQPKRALADIEEEAASIVRATRPTYERAPLAVRALKDVPLVGNFYTWTGEMVRTPINTVLQGIKEISSPDRKIIGISRLMGLLAAVSAVTGIASYSARKHGVSAQQEKDRKRFGPEWEKNSDLIYFRSANGQIVTADTGFIDPYKVWKEPVMAIIQGKDGMDKAAGAIQALLRPYVSETILTSTVNDLTRNQTPEGKPIWIDGDTPAEKWRAALNYAMFKAALPGTITKGMRLYYAETGNADFSVNPKGREYDKQAERLSLTGVRTRALDLEQSLLYKAVEFRNKIAGISDIFENRFMASGKVAPDALKEAYARMQQQRQSAFEDMTETVAAAKRLGLNDGTIIQKLRGAGLSQPESAGLVNNFIPPYRPGRASIGAAVQKDPSRLDTLMQVR